MTLRMMIKALVMWTGILVLAVANGIFREAILIAVFGLPGGLILSGLLLSLFIVGVTYLALPWMAIRKAKQLVAIGFVWLGLTLVFEFSFGLLQGKPLSVLLDAYTFKDGNIWPVVLIVTAAAPYLAAKLRSRVRKTSEETDG